jgi:hypothetical protein
MAQDSDVARVAAALKAPGIRYKRFGNDPIRSTAQPAENVANSSPLLEAPPLEPPVEPQGDAAPEPAPRHYEPPPVSFTPPPAGFGASPYSFAATLPPTEEIAGSAAAQLPFGAPPAYPERAVPYEARGAFPGFATMTAPQHQPLEQAPTYPQAPATYGFGGPAADPGQNNDRLLEALGRQADPPGQAPQPLSYCSPAPAGTFGSLLGAEASAPMQSFGQPAPQQFAFHHTGYGESGGHSGPSPAGFSPATLQTGNWPGPAPPSALLPAAMVTLPLAEVMRLVAIGTPVVSSPFAAFRVSGSVPNAR